MANKTKVGARQAAVLARKNAFLAAYENCGSIKTAARAARVKRTRHYEWLKEDADYERRFLEAQPMAADALMDEAVQRAMRGVFEPNVFKGRFCYPREEYVVKPAVLDRKGRIIEPEVRAWRDVPGAPPLGIWKKSEKLLIALLRIHKPEKYGRQVVELVQGPIDIVQRLNAGRDRLAAITKERLSRLTDDDRATLERIQAKLAG